MFLLLELAGPRLLMGGGDCFKKDQKRVGEDWRIRAKDTRNWRLLIENVCSDRKARKEKRKKTYYRNHGYDNWDAKMRITKTVSSRAGINMTCQSHTVT